MSELDKLWCALRDTQERVTELEERTSVLEDEEFGAEEDVTLEDWDDEEGNFEERSDNDASLDCDWSGDDEKAYQDSQKEEVTDEPES